MLGGGGVVILFGGGGVLGSLSRHFTRLVLVSIDKKIYIIKIRDWEDDPYLVIFLYIYLSPSYLKA